MEFSEGPEKKPKAIGITSGGLDSILSALVLREQGIAVSWICFETPFFTCDTAVRSAKSINIPIKIQDITVSYLEMLKYPRAGYGKNMNPCMDCHALMFHMAGREMEKMGADFLFSGEVVGQRPKSQTKNAMRYVEKHSGYQGYIVRPLSAKLLPETIPEKEGWVDRERLGAISGRSRSGQIQMARKFNLKAYPAPAGGCLLTDINYSKRLKDLMFLQKRFEKRELYLLRHGRHFRFDEKVKIIVGKNHEDNQHILSLYDHTMDILMRHASMPGPVAVMPFVSKRESIKSGAEICASYTKVPAGKTTTVKITTPLREERIEVLVKDPACFRSFMI